MKRMKGFRSLLAMTLAFVMLLSSAGSTLAFADEEPEGRQVYVKDGVVQTWVGNGYEGDAELAPEGTINNSIVINEHLALNSYGYPDAALEVSSSKKDSSITVDGSVVNNVPGYDGSAVEVRSIDHTASAKVTGDAVVQQEVTDNDYIQLGGTGVKAYCWDEVENSTAKAEASVDGNVIVTLSGKSVEDDEYEITVGAEGATTYTERGDLSAAVKVGKDESEEESEAADSGNVTVKVTAEGNGIDEAYAAALVSQGYGDNTISVQGNATATVDAIIDATESEEEYLCYR